MIKRKTTKATERPGWTYCRNCLYWRAMYNDEDSINDRKLAGAEEYEANCMRYPRSSTGWPVTERGDGCGEGGKP